MFSLTSNSLKNSVYAEQICWSGHHLPWLQVHTIWWKHLSSWNCHSYPQSLCQVPTGKSQLMQLLTLLHYSIHQLCVTYSVETNHNCVHFSMSVYHCVAKIMKLLAQNKNVTKYPSSFPRIGIKKKRRKTLFTNPTAHLFAS